MRKTTMAMALGLALSLGTVGVASAQSTQQPQRVEHEGRGMRRGPGEGLLKGINLTVDQKAKLKDDARGREEQPCQRAVPEGDGRRTRGSAARRHGGGAGADAGAPAADGAGSVSDRSPRCVPSSRPIS